MMKSSPFLPRKSRSNTTPNSNRNMWIVNPHINDRLPLMHDHLHNHWRHDHQKSNSSNINNNNNVVVNRRLTLRHTYRPLRRVMVPLSI
ncbi:hypothetical protein I7I53_12129 [Histoplasma capsulatum var. duboisii H88]|uniref:Uncharacterized protein n=1 Tax=Ajellomyces capsulatus (strain H88) TaxID=544711 RepID=A0A8A1LX77_AJEC8|nr:hypothetical protein I7I53_12129 [Histoplasma capsulatum var. duboisii H88]